MHHLLLLAAVASASFEDLEILDERILAVSGHAEQIDKRLKLVQCPDEPVIAPTAENAVIVRCPALGWRLRVPVRVPASNTAPSEVIVRKGEMVECVSGGPGFQVSTQMIALDNAGIGEPVRVKSQSSPIPITATVRARGLVAF